MQTVVLQIYLRLCIRDKTKSVQVHPTKTKNTKEIYEG